MTKRVYLWLGLAGLATLLAACPTARADSQVAGTYRCMTIQAGTKSRPCTSPSLVLYADGSYEIWGEEGTYTVQGKWVILSHSKKRGPGRLQPGRRIIFEFHTRGKKTEVIFQRRYDALPGSAFI